MILTDSRVVVTGADGFIGSHLVEELVAKGCYVKALCYYNSFGKWGWLDQLSKETMAKVEVITGDVRDPYGMRLLVEGADVVFHLAALIGIPYSYSSPDSYIDTNIKGTLNILNACRDYKTKRLLLTSTSEVYGTARYVPIDEFHPMQGQSPYSASKIGADRIAESFHKSFGLPLTIVRPFNTFGPRQSARAIIPTVISQILSGKKLLRLGNLTPTRDFNYVKDTANGFISIAESDKTIGDEINISSAKEISMGDLTKLIASLLGTEIEIETDNDRLRPEASEVDRLLGDNTKLLSLTSWNPMYGLKNGLLNTIEWFRDPENLRQYKPDIYNI